MILYNGLGKSRIKLIRSLNIKKFRDMHGLFIAEGTKLAAELISSRFKIRTLIATCEWLENFTGSVDPAKWKNFSLFRNTGEVIIDNYAEIKKVSFMKTPGEVILVIEIPVYSYNINDLCNELSLAFDNIQDPGNLGTVLRIAFWFGIHNIFCSRDSVDVFNPKVVQASMGAIKGLKVHYVDLDLFLKDVSEKSNIPVYGTFMKGNNIYSERLAKNGLVLFGNESAGISQRFMPYINTILAIPDFQTGENKPESLNISAAAAIVCSEFRRRI